MTHIHDATQQITDPNEAFRLLSDGNQRYVSGHTIPHQNTTKEWATIQTCQHPFAVVLGCADSRACPSELFDQRQGDLFVIRNAGNVADTTALGSIEYAVSHLKVSLIVVCGHSHCGAIGAALDITKEQLADMPKNLRTLVSHIHDSILALHDEQQAEKVHALNMANVIRNNPVVKQANTHVVAAYYDLASKQVEWLSPCTK